MISQLRQHKKLLEKLLADYAGDNEKWEQWQIYQAQQMQLFAQDRLLLIVSLAATSVFAIISLGFGLLLNNLGLLFLAILAFFGALAILYYFILWQKTFVQVSALVLPVQKHLVALTKTTISKPFTAIGERLLDLIQAFVREKILQFKGEHE
ncbi:MAG: hypothetical protein Q4G02_02730 [bacterium]|nr:hypothetical protein [bacterium]